MKTSILKFGWRSRTTPFWCKRYEDAFFGRLWSEWRRDLVEERSTDDDYFEKDGEHHLVAEIPGLKKEDILITLEKDILEICDEKSGNYKKRCQILEISDNIWHIFKKFSISEGQY